MAGGFWYYAQEDPDALAVVDPDGTEHTRRRRARALQPGRPRAARARPASRATRSPRSCPTASTRCTVYLAALQTGLYYVPINYRLSRAGDRVHPAGLRREGVHHPRALRRRRGARRPTRPGIPAEARLAHRHGARASASFDDAASPASPTTLPDDRTAGAAMHYTSGTTGKPKGVKRPLTGLDPDTTRRAVHVPARAVRHHAAATDNVHLCTSPNYHTAVTTFAGNALHIGHTRRLHGQVGPGGDAAR